MKRMKKWKMMIEDAMSRWKDLHPTTVTESVYRPPELQSNHHRPKRFSTPVPPAQSSQALMFSQRSGRVGQLCSRACMDPWQWQKSTDLVISTSFTSMIERRSPSFQLRISSCKDGTGSSNVEDMLIKMLFSCTQQNKPIAFNIEEDSMFAISHHDHSLDMRTPTSRDRSQPTPPSLSTRQEDLYSQHVCQRQRQIRQRTPSARWLEASMPEGYKQALDSHQTWK